MGIFQDLINKQQASNLIFSTVYKNDTLYNMSQLPCNDNSYVIYLPSAVFKDLNLPKSEGKDRIPPRVLLEPHKFFYFTLAILFNNSTQKIHST